MESEAQPDLVALAKPVLLEAVRQFCSGDISAEDFLDYCSEPLSLHQGGWKGLQGSMHAIHVLWKDRVLEMGPLIVLSTKIWIRYDHPDSTEARLNLLKAFKSDCSINGMTYMHLCSLCRKTEGAHISLF
jgi:hypothetical protein